MILRFSIRHIFSTSYYYILIRCGGVIADNIAYSEFRKLANLIKNLKRFYDVWNTNNVQTGPKKVPKSRFSKNAC